MSELLAAKIEILRSAGVRLFELLDAIEQQGDAPPLQRHGMTDYELTQVARRLLEERRDRDRFLPAELFSEPAWDMLLDLFVSHCERRDISVTSVCLATPAPATTALRWLDAIHKLGLVERFASVSDRRVTLVQLSQRGLNGMRGYLSSVCGSGKATSSRDAIESNDSRSSMLQEGR